MKIYLVGGAVRDGLLGLPVQDRDWVVVGATPEALVSNGFVPVGKDFPVFLHPQTGEEYALARTERKSAPGYRGFVVHAAADVTLEQDLARRDLTINSIAAPVHEYCAEGRFDADFEDLVDPFDGRGDLQRKILRHVTEAFREDPVRILRVARFAARFPDFSVAPETMVLMQAMVRGGEADALVPERVWQELARGLMAVRPSRMFEVLRACHALHALLPEIDSLWHAPQRTEAELASDSAPDTGLHRMNVLNLSAQLDAPLQVRFACLCQELGKGATAAPAYGARLLDDVCARLRVPNDCRELAGVVAREHEAIHRSGELRAAELVQLLERCDAFRKPARFDEVLLACECDARGWPDQAQAGYPQRPRLNAALRAAQSVDTASVAGEAQKTGADGRQIGERVHAARVAAVDAGLSGTLTAS